MTTVQVPVSLGGTNTAYNDGTGAYGMASNNGYGYVTYLLPMLAEVIAMCQHIANTFEGQLPIGTPVFRDDFRRANTAAGSIGGGWTLKGAYAGSYPLPAATTGEITNQAFTNAGGAVVYATRTLRSTPRQLQCRWSWVDDGVGTDFTTLAMIISSSSNLIDTMLHITITNSQLQIEKRVSGGAFVDLVSPVTISPSLSLSDVQHVATVTQEGTSVRVQIDDAVDVAVTDADVPSIVGPYIVVEHYSATTGVRYPMTIYEVAAA